jgi:hypothetical protein
MVNLRFRDRGNLTCQIGTAYLTGVNLGFAYSGELALDGIDLGT